MRDLAYWLFILLLCSMSVYFAYNAELRRSRFAEAKKVRQLQSGCEVALAEVLDGDELSVKSDRGSAFVVRLLGIKTFSSKSPKDELSLSGEAALSFWKAFEDKTLKLVFKDLERDSHDRVLAYLEYEDRDLGRELLQAGWGVVFERHSCSRKENYREVEKRARSERRGLWGREASRRSALAMKAAWEAMRIDD